MFDWNSFSSPDNLVPRVSCLNALLELQGAVKWETLGTWLVTRTKELHALPHVGYPPNSFVPDPFQRTHAFKIDLLACSCFLCNSFVPDIDFREVLFDFRIEVQNDILVFAWIFMKTCNQPMPGHLQAFKYNIGAQSDKRLKYLASTLLHWIGPNKLSWVVRKIHVTYVKCEQSHSSEQLAGHSFESDSRNRQENKQVSCP